jgi:hypothetical protein
MDFRPTGGVSLAGEAMLRELFELLECCLAREDLALLAALVALLAVVPAWLAVRLLANWMLSSPN